MNYDKVNIFKRIKKNKKDFKISIKELFFKKEFKLSNYGLFLKEDKSYFIKVTINSKIIFQNKKLGFYLLNLKMKNNDYLMLIYYKDLYYKNLVNSILILYQTKYIQDYNLILSDVKKIKDEISFENFLYKISKINFIKSNLIIKKEDLRNNLFFEDTKLILKCCKYDLIPINNL